MVNSCLDTLRANTPHSSGEPASIFAGSHNSSSPLSIPAASTPSGRPSLGLFHDKQLNLQCDRGQSLASTSHAYSCRDDQATYFDDTETCPLILLSSSPSLKASQSSREAPLLNDSSRAPLAVPVASSGVPRVLALPLLHANVAVRGIEYDRLIV